MFKTHFTRKNLIAIALVFFYGMTILLSAVMIDGNNPVFIQDNPVQAIAKSLFTLKDLEGRVVSGYLLGSLPAYFLVILFVIYLIVCTGSIIYEYRLAKFYDENPRSKKWLIVYSVTFLICLALWIGLAMVSQFSGGEVYTYYLWASFMFLAESLVIGTIIYALLALLIGNVFVLIINFKNINKPFKFIDAQADEEKAKKEIEDEIERAKKQGELASSFGEGQMASQVNTSGTNALPTDSNIKAINDESPLKDKERVFPGLCSLDYAYMAPLSDSFADDLNLKDLCTRFRNYLAHEEGLFFPISSIREFISGLAASRLIILEGLSGTGKSSLARYFSEFISEKSYFEAVQATWRDRTSILGYYNDFSKTYNETEFLKRLYEYSYKPEHINIMVLDELNISRIEYYFADFLSVLEYPEDEWKIKIMQFPYDFDAPTNLQDGILKIPANTYFIGTANKDESTFTITDKVYDRAITIDFDDKNEPFVTEGDYEKTSLSYSELKKLYSSAIQNADNQLNSEDYSKFKKLTDFTYETFDVTFGNRIFRQIQLFVPVYVACGGKKEEALDFMFSRKVISKLEGRFEDYVKNGLQDLKTLIANEYQEGTFSQTEHMIDKLIRKL